MEQLSKEFYLVYQPIKHSKCISCYQFSQRKANYEVLLRSVETHRFPPERFAELISNDENNRIFMDWVVQQLLDNLSTHCDIMLSINLDADQWGYPSTFEALDKLSIFAECIMIEVTEHYPKHQHQVLAEFDEVLTKVRQKGFSIAVDDCGEGINTYSFLMKHLKHIKRVKLALKPNQCLFRTKLIVIVSKVLRFLKIADIEIVAERVETESVSQTLTEMGVDYQQGYLFGKGNCEI